MDECFVILNAHGKFEVDTTTSHDNDLLLPMGNTLASTVAIAQAKVVAAKQAKVFEEEFAVVQATCLAKHARVDSPPPATTPVLLDPKGKSSVDLYLHPDADEEDCRQEDVLEADAWAQWSGKRRTPFKPQAKLAHYLGTLSTGVMVFVHADYSPNGCYNIFALRSLSKGKGRWCTPYVPFERKIVFCMTQAQAHEVYNLPNSGVDSQLLTEADFTNKDWLKCFKKVPKRGSKVKCRDVMPELSNKFYVLFTFMFEEPPGNYGIEVTKDGAARKPIEDAKEQRKTSKDQVEKATGENNNTESERKVAATSNIDNIDHIISMIAKSTMKDLPDVDSSFRVKGQVPCASNIEDQEDKNTEFFVLNTGEDTNIIIDKFEPPQKYGDASMDAGGIVGAGNAGEDTKIIIEKSEPPQEDSDTFVDADGDASCAGGSIGAGDARENTEIIIENFESPQEDGDASCAGGAGEDMEIIIEKSEPP
ncbi:hypothetical protein L7F22_027088 [Adiantum nelumboides]|nr:hypothetical protein [Adiantum nelumboides]